MACFCAGTLIRTARGDIPVENLRVGDLAITCSGQRRPIRWIGHRKISCLSCPRPHEARPIRIAAHAFGENRPSRDLSVSPNHAICVDIIGEILIPASSLINGSTIRQVDVDEVTYWHVELDSHDVLLAENLPAESYLEMCNRGFFQEAAVVNMAADPGLAQTVRTHDDFCRPFHIEGALVDFVRGRLAASAAKLGWRLSDCDPWAGVHVLADGLRIEPDVHSLSARFVIPAEAGDVWIISPATSPRDIGMGSDGRRLGLNIVEMLVGPGWDTRSVSLEDPLLCVGFHVLERSANTPRRWTGARARLPAALWSDAELGQDITIVLRLCAGTPALPRWGGPEPVLIEQNASSDVPRAVA